MLSFLLIAFSTAQNGPGGESSSWVSSNIDVPIYDTHKYRLNSGNNRFQETLAICEWYGTAPSCHGQCPNRWSYQGRDSNQVKGSLNGQYAYDTFGSICANGHKHWCCLDGSYEDEEFLFVRRDVWCKDSTIVGDSKGYTPGITAAECKRRCLAHSTCNYMLFGVDVYNSNSNRCTLFENCKRLSAYADGTPVLYARKSYKGCVPYSEDACRKAAEADPSLQVGHEHWGFTTQNSMNFGCTTRVDGLYTGHVFYNTEGTVPDKSDELDPTTFVRPVGYDCRRTADVASKPITRTEVPQQKYQFSCHDIGIHCQNTLAWVGQSYSAVARASPIVIGLAFIGLVCFFYYAAKLIIKIKNRDTEWHSLA